MPMYDYECKNCGHEEKDIINGPSNISLKCPKCNTSMIRQFPRTTNFKLKGDDWSKDGTCLNKNEDVVK